MSIGCRTLHPQIKEENKQGIVSILGISGDGNSEKRLKTEYPLRRTLSADMSSKKFLALHDPVSPSMKKIASSGAIPIFSGTPASDEEEEDENRASQSDIWNLIQSQKPAIPTAQPYVHPLVRRSSSSLSSKSLELCTESLGSETGSEFSFSPPSPTASFFSSFPPSPSPSSEVIDEEGGGEEGLDFLFGGEADRRKGKQEIDEEKCVNYNCTTSRRSPARSFPPPLPSISRRDGPRLHMKPHRQDGRLVLQAVALPSHNYLQAQRQGGRLLLSFITTPQQQEEEETEEEEEEDEVAAEEWVGAEIIEEEEEVEEEGEEKKEAEVEEEEVEVIVNGEGAKESKQEDGKRGEKEAEGEDTENRLEVVCLEMWRSKGPAVMELHRSIGKLISQPFMNINPWVQKKKIAAETAAVAAAAEREQEVAAQRLNRYERCWNGGGLGEGKVVGAEGLVGGLVPRRCQEPRRTHPVWILERHCVATT